MRKIKLFNGKGEVLVDDDDFLKFNGIRLILHSGGYATFHIKGSGRFYLHRKIMKAQTGHIVDHINGNKLDNRKENLRFCTKSQNNRWRLNQKRGKSGYLGVSYFNHAKGWRAYVKLKDRQLHIGIFSTPQKAARERDKIAKKLFGEFAILNFN